MLSGSIANLSLCINFSGFELDLLTVNFSLSINNTLWLNLGKELWTKWAHFEFHLLSALSQVKLLWVKHPLIWGQVVVLATNYEGEVTELVLVLALNEGVSGWDLLVGQGVECEGWH